MIEVKNVYKKFTKKIDKNKEESFYADNDISFTANGGEIVGILGPNGAGKSTLLRIVAGIMEPTKGTVLYDDLNFKKNEIEIKKQISFLSGNTKIYKDLSVYEYLTMCGDIYEIPKDKIEKKIEEVVKEFGLTNFLHQKIDGLSTGQTQRVNLARCIIHDPKYYILDEATSGLDVILSQVVLDFIKREKKNGKCILYSTHYMEEAENICDKVILIHKGKIIKVGTPKDIVKETKTSNLRDAFFSLIGGDVYE